MNEKLTDRFFSLLNNAEAQSQKENAGNNKTGDTGGRTLGEGSRGYNYRRNDFRGNHNRGGENCRKGRGYSRDRGNRASSESNSYELPKNFEPEAEESRCNDSRVPQNKNKPMVKQMGYRYLESLLDHKPIAILTTLASPKSGFQELINDRPIRDDLIILIFKVLSRVIDSEMHHLKMQILSDTFIPEFFDEIKRFTGLICIEDNQQRLRSIGEFFSNLLSVIELIINVFPSMMNEKLKSVMVAINMSMNNVQNVVVSDILFVQLKNITDQVNSYVENTKKIDRKLMQTNSNVIPAPDDFRQLPVIPTIDDFIIDKAFLRPNVVSGSYKDVDHYLDTQFRLLREDFVAPLRAGIHEYIESLSAPRLNRKFTNVRIYPKVQFKTSHKSRDIFGFLIAFDCDNKLPRKVNWDYNKRFMVGSLLLFSDDDFQTFYLATVVERNVSDHLEKGLLCVAFVPGTDVPGYVFEPETFFVMAESEVYYEAYRPVLAALQRMNTNDFPMKKYIVDVETTCFPPGYLVNKSQYEVCGYKVNLLDDDGWPTPEQLKLNASQHQALKSALTNDFVVIQGPPGTGKTFLALKITEILLKNKVSADTPILVICYTNHALDQFLEGILKYTKSLIRIGSQSKNESLKEYSIEQVKKGKRSSRSYHQSALFREVLDEKFYLIEKLKHLEMKIEEINMPLGILNLKVLKSVVTPQQYNELKDNEVEWLFCSDSPDFFSQEESLLNESHKEEVVPTNNSQPIDMFANVSEFEGQEDIEEGEIDEDENAQRLADMIEDDFFEDDFIYKENYIAIEYSLEIESIKDTIERELYNLETCTLPENPIERYNFEERTKQHIHEMNKHIQFIECQFSRFYGIKFDPMRFKMFQDKSSVWEISPHERWEYYMTLIHLYSCQLNQTIQYLTNRYQTVLMKMDELKQLDDLQFVNDAAVIGMTTSGAAKRRILLENLNCEIVIVEEAAEVLEAHIVTALTPSVQHVILIGDHKQLKPNPAVYHLAKKYNLDVSLFERMLRNGLGCSVLGVQHRMRPEIASLVCPTIYPVLANHPSTADRPKISGLDKFVFFITHNHPEDQLPDSSSRQNKHEADFLLALCQYLLNQGYQPEEITILATYTGQVWYMRKEKRRLSSQNQQWKNVRITPVDNFQGEENRIILLSLVRSNKEARIGFLGTENRVCVALSRAKEGLYICGNMDNLTDSSVIWPKIKQRLDEINAVGRQLIIRCERHPDQVNQVSTAKDFSVSPDGGCSLKCDFQLSCGHKCPRVCHIIDSDHRFYRCKQACNRAPCTEAGHKCPLRCWEPCQPCVIKVKRELLCGHSASLKCYLEPALATCKKLVPVTLPDCGHSVDKYCYLKVEECRCSLTCTLRLPCGHACRLNCHVKEDPDHLEYFCMKDCTKPNAECRRNHPCPKRCYEQCGACDVPVFTRMTCGHSENIPCSQDESSVQCQKPCTKTLACGHKCSLPCWLPCDPDRCTVKVDKVGTCGHTFKGMKCNETTECRKCMNYCSRQLPCGHACTEKCFKDCTQVVCKEMVKSSVTPACGHLHVQIPCHLNKPVAGLHAGSDELVQLCEEPCSAKLLCGHVCSGTCGKCMQGRLHVPCEQQCELELICGHRCKAKCNTLCPPCQSKNCFNNCDHMRCGKNHPCSLSSSRCDPCTRRCNWTCDHYKCTKQCSQECNRPVCNEPCTYVLKCGHLCIGYCGERHPSLCRVCNVDNPIFENSDDFDRFVLLEDCNHVIKNIELEKLITAATQDARIRLLQCPQCEGPIVKTKRCRNHYIHFMKQQNLMSRLIIGEVSRLRKIHARHVELFKSSPTNSVSMNKLLLDCSEAFKGEAEFGRLIIALLLQPLAARCQELKPDSKKTMQACEGAVKSETRTLNTEEEQRLRLRLEYLVQSLRLRLKDISYPDIIQIELEVARVMRALSSPALISYWYDVTSFSWAKDLTLRQVYNLVPLEKVSSTLKTRDSLKQWFRCEKDHLYVSQDGVQCSFCRELEEERQRMTEEQERKNQPRPTNLTWRESEFVLPSSRPGNYRQNGQTRGKRNKRRNPGGFNDRNTQESRASMPQVTVDGPMIQGMGGLQGRGGLDKIQHPGNNRAPRGRGQQRKRRN